MGYAIYSKTEIINHITDPENARKFIAQKFQNLISEFLETMPGTKMSEKK